MEHENLSSVDLSSKVTKQYYKGRFIKAGKLNRVTNLAKIKDDERQKHDKIYIEQERRRRVVELDYLAEQLFCKIYACQAQLDLRKIHRETLQGFASILYINCDKCGKENAVHTCRRSTANPEFFEVNLKITMGTLDAGIGAMHLNKLLSAANLPKFEETTFKRHERIVTPKLQEAVHESCVSAAREEKKLTGPGGKLRASADMGWQRRNSGFKYDSLTGHSSLIGEKCGKIMAVKVMSSTCRACKFAGGPCGKKTCKRNHDGSAKSMEAAAAVHMLKSPTLVEADVTVDVLVGDADSSTAAAVREEFGDTVERALDLVHTQKVLKNDLYKLQKIHKLLDKGVIAYFVATVGTIVKKNSGNVANMQKDLLNIAEHAFNKHDGCDIEWCSYLQKASDGESSLSYKSKYFNKQLGLHGGELYCSIKACIEKLVKKSDQLAAFGSTQPCESFNNIVGSKAPKIRYYGDTESLTNRVYCATLQMNDGVEYVSTVMQKLLLSPGKLTAKYRQRLQKKRLYQAKRVKLAQFKARRKLMLQRRGVSNRRKEAAEGITYKSGMAFEETAPKPMKTRNATILCKVWKNETPATLPALKLKKFSLTYFDVETAGFNAETDDLLQISAQDEDSSFSVYCLPTKPIPTAASQVTMLTSMNGKLLYKDELVAAVPLKIALQSFLLYLKQKKVRVLAAHNASFDVRFLYNKMRKFKLLKQAATVINGYVDTLKLARQKFKKATPAPINLKLSTLVQHELGPGFSFQAHDSTEDVRALKALVEHWCLPIVELNKGGHSFKDYIALKRRCRIGTKLDEMAAAAGLTSRQLKHLVHMGFTVKKLKSLCQDNTIQAFQEKMTPISEECAAKMFHYLRGESLSSPLPHQSSNIDYPQKDDRLIPCRSVTGTGAASLESAVGGKTAANEGDDRTSQAGNSLASSRSHEVALKRNSSCTGNQQELITSSEGQNQPVSRPKRIARKPKRMEDFLTQE